MGSASLREERARDIHMDWERVFIPGTMKINIENSNVWLENVPNLCVECSETKVSEYLGESFKVGNEELSTRDASLNVASSLLLPKKFARSFPLKSSGSRISRIFLRKDFINLWNALVDEQDTEELRILSSASGLGKSIYLYLIAVFARHFKIPVQYIGNTRDLFENLPNERSIASTFAAMLLFMNLKILDELGPFYPGDPDYKHLRGLAMKHVIFYAHERGDLVLCAHSTWECKFVIATSQLHEFKLPSGYEFSVQYVEPLSREEFAIWENLSDYPPILKDNSNEVIDLTGFVPRMIALLVNFANTFVGFSFVELVTKFTKRVYRDMKKRHDAYVNSLKGEEKETFYNMLYKLFLGRETPATTLFDSAYQDRGLLIPLHDESLQFYNSIARDILFESFSNYYFTKERLVEVSNKFKEARRECRGGGAYFEQLFLYLCYQFRPDIEVYSRASHRTIHLNSNVRWLRFDGKKFMPQRSKVNFSCWIKFGENYPSLDYAYVYMTDGSWMLYLIQVSVSSFPVHNRDSARLELLFEKTGGTVPLASLLNSFFDGPFEVSPVYNDRKKIMDFEVTDSQGISFRDRISILYVTSLTREDAKADSAPEFVEFLTFDNFPGYMKSYIDVGQKVRSRRSSPSRRSVKRIKSEVT
ncbi:hypothetical protein GAYE_SCF45G5776 [Galdieria yellowstonensis]|uniref:Crinkler (CRN) family protein n=1 Tax=Galdieria yellowstonensis TaxID=3028027 RepID=A0AAV9IKM5_9RHOD|nr:hypothetical protein GAYE_SCF45G5776 [Galdieria yellowstonensis]